jgi:spore coat protein JB
MMHDELMREVQIAHFSLIETNLYLDTHPCDTEAIKALEYYGERLKEAVKRYEEECGMLAVTNYDGGDFDWVKKPFPWETEC